MLLQIHPLTSEDTTDMKLFMKLLLYLIIHSSTKVMFSPIGWLVCCTITQILLNRFPINLVAHGPRKIQCRSGQNGISRKLFLSLPLPLWDLLGLFFCVSMTNVSSPDNAYLCSFIWFNIFFISVSQPDYLFGYELLHYCKLIQS